MEDILLFLYCIQMGILLIMLFLVVQILKSVNRKIKKKFKRLRNATIYLFDAICSPFVWLLAYIVPKKKNLILFMGRDKSGYLDNNKYLLMYLFQNEYDKEYDIRYVGHRDIAANELTTAGITVVRFPSLSAYFLMLRAAVVITDNAHWTTHNRNTATLRSRRIQLWHGIGFKRIRLSDPDFVAKSKGIIGFFRYRLQGRLAIYDLFVSSSEFFSEEVFSPSFHPKKIVELGYARNDILFEDIGFKKELLDINVDVPAFSRIKKMKESGNKIVLYSPTFRKAKYFSLDAKDLDFYRLNSFAEENSIVIVFKLHPLPRHDIDFSIFSNIVEYNQMSDIYPVFRYIDMLVTDYSSIYMDYLLLNRPCAFFMYDYDYYTTQCRGLQEYFLDMLPGEICSSQSELQNAIQDALINGNDNYKEKRQALCDQSWKYKDGLSALRIWEYIENEFFSRG